jgi:hypothetical protein
MYGFRYRLYSDDWDELGGFTTAVPNWSQGDEFMTGDGRRFRLTGSCGVQKHDLAANQVIGDGRPRSCTLRDHAGLLEAARGFAHAEPE